MLRRLATFAICAAVVLSLTNGSLIVSQLFGWASMIRERAPEVGWAQAAFASLDGSELCNVCLSVRAEAEKRRASEPEGEAAQSAPLFGAAGEQSICHAPRAPRPERCPVSLERGGSPDGRPREVAKTPPRFEAQA